MSRTFHSLVTSASIGPAFLGALLFVAISSFGTDPANMWIVIPLAFPAALTLKYAFSDSNGFEKGVSFDSAAGEWLDPTFGYFIFVMIYTFFSVIASLPILFIMDEVFRLSDGEYMRAAHGVSLTLGYLPILFYWIKLRK